MIKKGFKRLSKELEYLNKELKFQFSYKKSEFQPVFLIGCGRSGTTVLGNTIGKHESITYLNERRDLWHQAYPGFDIWSGKISQPKLIAESDDNNKKKTEILRKLFYREQICGNSKILLEKLPINNFRLKFIEDAFPDAKYIYLQRNGIEVAKSIEKRAEKGWFGKNNIKWNLIEKLSKRIDISTELNDFSNFEKGLLEWRFSLEFSESFFSTINEKRYYSLSYKTFLENPKLQIENIYRFLDLDFNDNFTTDITKGIRRRSEEIHDVEDIYSQIGGSNLKLSIEDKMKQTAPNNAYKK